MRHPVNYSSLQLLKLKHFFLIVCSHYGADVAKIFNKYKEIIPKKFWETLNLFSHPESPGKKRAGIIFTFPLPVTSRDQSNYGKLFLEIQAGRTNSRFPKTALGNISLYLLNIFATAGPKSEQKIFKNYISIIAMVNDRNWLKASPPLRLKSNLLLSRTSCVL